MEAMMVIVLEGLPERVQEIADVLDRECPGQLTWGRFANPGLDHVIRLEGKTAERHVEFCRPPPWPSSATTLGKAWKLSPASGRPAQQGGLFCASLSRALS